MAEPEMWGRWDDDGPYFVKAEGLTLEEAKKALEDVLDYLIEDGFEVVATQTEPVEREVCDCDEGSPVRPCRDLECKHFHTEMVYEFYVEEVE